MHCKRCGKALGTDRGICPFCGAMMSKEQMNIYKEMQKEKMFTARLLTEKYGEKPVYYEKQTSSNKIFLFLFLGIFLLILFLICFFFV